jgi:acetyltransferase-like isoleucine patch superfamily enzyme
MSDIVLFGAGQIADVARVYMDRHSPDRIVAFTVDASHRTGDAFAGRPLVDWEDLERHYPPDRVKLLGPLSFRRLNEFRRARYEEGKARGYRFASFIHPSCQVYTEAIGENCFMLEGNALQPFSEIGDNTILWSNNIIGHHARVGSHCFVSSEVGVSSNSRIGDGCFLAGRVSISYGRTLGQRCFVGMGSVVLDHLADESVILAASSKVERFGSRRLQRFL